MGLSMSIKTLKIYIEPASLPLTQQLINYVQSIDDENVYSILILERLKINIDEIQNGRTVYAYKVNENLSQKLNSVARFILNRPGFKVEIHTNIFRAQDILLPLLKQILPFIPQDTLQLHLYDDGTGTLLQRAEMRRFDGKVLSKMMHERAEVLHHLLTSNKPLDAWEWNVVDNYVWHYFLDAKYYLLQSPRESQSGNRFFDKLQRATVPLNYDDAHPALLSTVKIWDRLLAIPEGLRAQLSETAKNNEAVLFLTTYYIDVQKREEHHRAMLKKIAELKSSGALPDEKHIIYKGHPVNGERNHALRSALGENITELPDNIPLEYLHAQGLLPKNIAGCFSSSFFSMKNKNVKFVIMNGHAGNDVNRMNIELIKLYGCFDTDNIIYLEDHAGL